MAIMRNLSHRKVFGVNRGRVAPPIGSGVLPGSIRGTITVTPRFFGALSQTHQLGATFSSTPSFVGNIASPTPVPMAATITGVASFAGDISTSSAVNVGASFGTTITFAGDTKQTFNLGATITGTLGFAGDAVTDTWDYNTEYLLHF